MTHSTKAFAIWLPLLVAMTLIGWLLFGALPGMRMTGDLIAWLMELPVTTCYAIAAGGATFLTLQLPGIALELEDRIALMKRAQAGDLAARDAVRDDTKIMLGVLITWAVFFFPHY
jgi:hypothetical protein